MGLKKHPIKLGCAFAVLVPVLAAVLWHWQFCNVPHDHFDRLLAGDASVEVVSVTITGQREPKIEISDHESIRYLTQAFRTLDRNPKQLGVTYTLGVKFKSCLGATYMSVFVSDDASGWAIGYPTDSFDDPKYYWLPFSESTPQPVIAAFNRMKAR